jgi:uncharacterized protein YkwD
LLYMGKIVKKKKVVATRPARKRPVTLSYSKTIFITMGVLFLTLFLFVFETQKYQEQRSSAAGTNCDVAAADLQMNTEENNLLQLINQYRASKGAPAVTLSTALTQSASWMSLDMSKTNILQHTDSLGRTLQARITDCGFTAAAGVGENIAKGTGTNAQEIFTLWQTSTEGHNEEMLNPAHKVIGIGQSGVFWTADFGDNADPVASTVPSPAMPSTIVPSFNTLAPCPSCSTPEVSVAPSQPAVVEPITSTVPVEEISPVISTAEEQPALPGATTGGEGGGGIMDLIKLILQFLQQLLAQLFGGGNGGNGGNHKHEGKGNEGQQQEQKAAGKEEEAKEQEQDGKGEGANGAAQNGNAQGGANATNSGQNTSY